MADSLKDLTPPDIALVDLPLGPDGETGKAYRLAVGNLVLLRHDRPEHVWYSIESVLRAESP
jgi:hypothetical protein